MSGETVKIRFKEDKDDTEEDAVLELISGSGLTWADNVMDAQVDEDQAAGFSEADYFIEMELTRNSDDYKRNYVSAIARFHNGRFDGVADSSDGTITVNDDNGEVVIIEVTDSGGGGGQEFWRGAHDCSGNAFPSTGGSGSGGAIESGNQWYVSVAGELVDQYGDTVAVGVGALLIALTDAPGQDGTKWRII